MSLIKKLKQFSKVSILLIMGIMVCLLSSCSIESKDEKKLKDIEFTVVPNEDIPSELKNKIEEKKKDEFKMTYDDKQNLYIVVGFGTQPTGGYSISVLELYETKNGVYFKTQFNGPSKTESVSQSESFPFIVVKIEYTDKAVVFK